MLLSVILTNHAVRLALVTLIWHFELQMNELLTTI